MAPIFPDQTAWQQASLVLQPTLIRLLDQLRQRTEALGIEARFEDGLSWPDGTTPEQQQRWSDLELALYRASAEEAPRLEAELAQLPTPTPRYRVELVRGDRHDHHDVWELCYRICFPDYLAEADFPGRVAPELIGEDGDCDWHELDRRTAVVVGELLQAPA